MYKKVCMVFFIAMLCMNVHASNNQSGSQELTEVKSSISSSLNQTVKKLKGFFFDRNTEVEETNAEVDTLQTKAEHFVELSEEEETNRTVLPHGRTTMKKCADNQLLKWDESAEVWKCDDLSVLKDCTEEKGLIKECDKEGNCTCQQVGKFEKGDHYWTPCKGAKEKYKMATCDFVNTDSGRRYSVDRSTPGCKKAFNERKDYACPVGNSGCLKPVETLDKVQACGSKGATSACKCEPGYTYVSRGGNVGKCFKETKTQLIKPKTYRTSFCTDHFTKIRIIPDGKYIELVLEAQNPASRTDTRCHLKDYASGAKRAWLSRNGLKGWAHGAYKRLDRIYVGREVTNIQGFKYTFTSWGAGGHECHTVRGSGQGNSTNANSTGGKSHGYAFDNRSLSHCPGNGAQIVQLKINMNEIYDTLKHEYKQPPLCAKK